MKILIFAFSLLFLIVGTISEYSYNHFQGGIFKLKPPNGKNIIEKFIFNFIKLGLYQIDVNLPTNDDVITIGMGSFRNQKFNDLLLSNSNLNIIYLFSWNSKLNIFQQIQSYSLPYKFISAIPVDFNNDGFLDLLLIENIEEKSQFKFHIYFNTKSIEWTFNFNEDFNNSGLQIIGANIHPHIIQMSGNQLFQIFYTDENYVRQLIFLDQNNQLQREQFPQFILKPQTKINNYCLDSSEALANSIAKPHFNQFVDINGDCIPDHILVSQNLNGEKFLEVYITQSDGSICLINYEKLPYSFQNLNVIDINQDGSNDLIIGLQNAKLLLFYNKIQLDQENLCSQSNEKFQTYPYETSEIFKQVNIISVPFPTNYFNMIDLDQNKQGWNFFNFQNNYNDFPAHLRFADLFAKGYPNLMVTFQNEKTYIYSNNNCDLDSYNRKQCLRPNQNNNYLQQRIFSLNSDNNYLSTISSINSQFGVFFDLGEQGVIDILLVRKLNDSMHNIISIYNNLNPDTFFLKAVTFNDKKNHKGSAQQVGVSYQCIVTQLKGQTNIASSRQLSQTGNNAMDIPFGFFGLGRTNNYVEQFTVGLAQQNNKLINYKSWSPIIPNSYLIIQISGEKNKEWGLDIFINPTSATIIIVLTTLGILMILGIMILLLHRKEKEEDKKQQDAFVELFR